MSRAPTWLSFGCLIFPGCITPAGLQKSNLPTPDLWQFQTSSATLVSPASTTTAVRPSSSATVVNSLSPTMTTLSPVRSISIDQNWWQNFGDSTLNAIVVEALQNNKSLAIAKARVEEARAARGIARSILFPQLNGDLSASRGNLGIATNNIILNQAQAGVDATWELDIFGHNQARSAEAQAILESAQANEQAVLVSLLAEVARNYFDMRNYENQIALTKKNLENQKKTFDIITAQVQGALASDFDLQRAGAQVSTTESQIPALQSAYDATLNRLNVLLGVPPGTRDVLLKTVQPLKPLDPAILVAAPAAVLANRPDVRASERRLAATLSARRAAISDFFPRISLLGFYGFQTSDLFVLTPWNVGAQLIQPLLNFGLLRSQYHVATARQSQAFFAYQETVLEALENMENALSSFLNEFQRNRLLSTAVDQNRKAAELAQLQFTGGFTGLLDVLIAQANVLNAESARAASEASLRKNLVNIYAAAGGGWDSKAVPQN